MKKKSRLNFSEAFEKFKFPPQIESQNVIHESTLTENEKLKRLYKQLNSPHWIIRRVLSLLFFN